MKTLRQKTYLVALLILVAAFFAGCKGESSPTAPTTSTNPGGGGVTPPTGASVTLTVSNASPFVSGTSTITATVTQSGQPVPNGTAVEFTTDFGTFTETGAASALRTTTNGVATVTLTSSTAGKATIQAVVNNVARTTSVTFQVQQQPQCGTPGQPPCVTIPTITSISPAFGNPGGGETVTITGTNLAAPVRVFFDFGAGTTPKEAFVVSQTATSIVVVSPPTDLGTGQTKSATIVVFNQAGTTSEARLTAPTPFVYQAEVLTPSITTLSPSSGPIDGGTRVTIFGDAFQAPVQVFFGSAEAQVISVQFKQLIVMSPTARDTAPGGSGTVTGAVDVKVINISSSKTATLTQGFRYTAKMQITAVGPTQGPATGGTKVVIDGIGFNDPVAVVIGGFAALPIKVTGTQVTAVTSAITPTTCGDVSGPITVTNVDNGDSAAGPNFIYKVPKPVIISVTPTTPVSPGASVTVQVANALAGTTKITVGDKAAFITNASTNTTTNVTTYTVTIASTFTFPTQPCAGAGGVTGTQSLPLSANVTYLNVESTCTDTATGALTINPPSGACVLPPPPNGVVSPTPPTCASGGNIVAAGAVTGTAQLTVTNTAGPGAQSLIITNASASSQVNGTFTVSPTNATLAPGASQVFTITIDPTAAVPYSANIDFTSNNPTGLQGCVSGNGT